MTNNSNLSQAHAQSVKSEPGVIRIIIGAPAAGKSSVAVKRVMAEKNNDSVILVGPHDTVRETMIKKTMRGGRNIIVDSNSEASAMATLEFCKTIPPRKLVVESVFAPFGTTVKRRADKGDAADRLVEGRNGALRAISKFAGQVDRFELACNSFDHVNSGDAGPKTVVVAENGNVQSIVRERVSFIMEQIRREGPAIEHYLTDAGISSARISTLLEEHGKASAIACGFLHSILQGQKIKFAPQASL